VLHNQPESSQELLRRNNRDLVDVMGAYTAPKAPALAAAHTTRLTRVQPTGQVTNMRTRDVRLKQAQAVDPAAKYGMPQTATPDGPSVGTGAPFDPKVLKLLQSLGARYDATGQLTTRDASRLQRAYGWKHTPDELDLVEGLMEMEAAQGGPVDPAAVGATRVGRKLAWEVEDEDGNLHSNHPLRYASKYAPPPSNRRVGVPPSHPDYDQKFVAAALAAALKKLPAGHKLHWLDDDAVVGQRAWYNPARYVKGRDIYGEQEHTLDATADDAARAQMVGRIAPPGGDPSPLYAYLPANYANDLYGPPLEAADIRHEPDLDAYRAFGADDTQIAAIQSQAAAHNARLDARASAAKPGRLVDPTTVKAAAHPVARWLRGATMTAVPTAVRTPPAALRTTAMPAAAAAAAPRPAISIRPAAAMPPHPAPGGGRRYPDRSMVDNVGSWAPAGAAPRPARRLPPELAPGLITGTAGAAGAYGLGQAGGAVGRAYMPQPKPAPVAPAAPQTALQRNRKSGTVGRAHGPAAPPYDATGVLTALQKSRGSGTVGRGVGGDQGDTLSSLLPQLSPGMQTGLMVGGAGLGLAGLYSLLNSRRQEQDDEPHSAY
jgi:hypothetical protein